MHGSVLGFFAHGALTTSEVADRDVLEVGSLDVNGSIRPMVEHRGPASYVGIDIVDGPGVDRVLDASELIEAFAADSFDVVISCEMLEHAQDWQHAIANMVTVLRPGGVLLITTRSPGFAYHHPPDHWRYTQAAFEAILRRLGLTPLVLMDDPEHPGVFVKARKPSDWRPPSLLHNFRVTLGDVPGVTPMHEPLKLLGLPYNPDGTGYYRFWSPWNQLNQRSGHLVVIPPPGQHEWIPSDDDIEQFDLVARQRPGGRVGVREWERWATLGPKLVYETDDDLLNVDPSGLPHLLDEARLDTIRRCLAVSDLVTVSTEPLAVEMRQYNDNVVVIPDLIHEDLLTLERPVQERVTVGWAGGSSHLQDLVLVQNPLTAVLDAHPDVDMHFLGMDYSPLLRRQCTFTNWHLNVWDYYAAIDADIGLAPLVDTPFNACRANIKCLEFAALGIPVIASDVPAYREFVRDGETGYLVRTEAEWQARLRELVNDPAMRTEMGAKARDVAGEWTIQKHWRKWADAYEHLAGWPTSTGGHP